MVAPCPFRSGIAFWGGDFAPIFGGIWQLYVSPGVFISALLCLDAVFVTFFSSWCCCCSLLICLHAVLVACFFGSMLFLLYAYFCALMLFVYYSFLS